MNKTRMSYLSLIALALLVGPGIIRNAEAQVRFNATVHTPSFHVRIGDASSGRYRSYTTGHLPARRLVRYMLVKRDRAIARRLARYTGVPARELIKLRIYGYRWFEIGNWLRLPRHAVRAAMNQRSWVRFLRMERRLARRGVHPLKRRRIAYFEID